MSGALPPVLIETFEVTPELFLVLNHMDDLLDLLKLVFIHCCLDINISYIAYSLLLLIKLLLHHNPISIRG